MPAGSGTGTPIANAGRTPEQLAQKAERLLDEVGSILPDSADIEEEKAFVVDVVNSFQEDIAEHILPITDFTQIATADTWYDFPANFISIYTDNGSYVITKDGVDWTGLLEIRQVGYTTQIKFPESGTFSLKIETTPTDVTQITDTINMHPYLVGLGALYLAWKYQEQQNVDDQSITAMNLLAEYRDKKGQRLAKLSNPTGRPQQVANSMGW